MTSTVPSVARTRRHQSRRTQTPQRQSTRHTSELERRLIQVIAAVAALGAAFSGGEPTGLLPVDVVLLGGFAAVVTIATSRSRRWTWIVLGGVAAVGAGDTLTLVLGGAALLVAIAGSLTPRRRLLGALVGGLAIQSLLRLGELGFHGGSALATVAAVAPVLVSGYLLLPRRRRRLLQRAAIATGVFIVFSIVLFGLSVLLAANGVATGIDDVRHGLALAGDGDLPAATAFFESGSQSLGSSADHLDAWWAKPARLVPVLAQQSQALERTTREATNVADAAAAAAVTGDFDTIRYQSGRIDLAQVTGAQAPLAAAVVAMDDAAASIEDVDDGWLLPPIRDRLRRFDQELLSTRDEVFLASLAARELPGMLGGDGERHYLVIFTQPAESRGLGGLLGAWVELRAVDGELDVVDSGKSTELNRAGPCEQRTISGPEDYKFRYDRFRPQCFIQDLPLSPDFPSVAEVTRQMYEQTKGVALDGVIAVDPAGLASILEITGPVQVTEFGQRLTATNATRFLLHDQYIVYDRDEESRDDFLEAALRTTFDQLVEGDVPGPKRISTVLGATVNERHLMAHFFRPGEQELMLELESDGALPAPPAGSDAFLLVTQNKGNNKIDSYLRREISYRAEVDPRTGNLDATATVTLFNDAPAAGLPDSIIGNNDQGLDFGTNAVFFNFYTPHRVTGAVLDGEPFPMELQRELGWAVYSRFFNIPPGGQATVVLDITGEIERGTEYSLDIGHQPLANPDRVSVDVVFPRTTAVVDAPGMAVLEGGTAVGTRFEQVADRRLVIEVAPA